jgi:hypothetical protein
VSHARERAEKTCLNCNNRLYGRFCHICGQENTDPRESFWSIVTHFFNDLTHFDGKFFTTAGTLVTMPGYLPLEYMRGRRARYLHPIRLYLFTSAFFFLVFYSLSPTGTVNADSAAADSVVTNQLGVNSLDSVIRMESTQRTYTTVAEYDSIQKSLPTDDRDSWLTRKFNRASIERSNRYPGRADIMYSSLFNNFIHTFPYLLFVCLPISALYLKLLYVRNKNNLYAGHAIFLVYLYVFTFLMLLLFFATDKIQDTLNIAWLSFIQFAILVFIAVYALIAMKAYYAERWRTTIVKFVLWNILAFVTILALFVLFFLLTLLRV